MRHTFRLGRGARWLPALGATVALAVVPSAASAHQRHHGSLPNGGVNGAQAWWNYDLDPQQTNVPYLAWNGEEIRLESCVPIVESYVAAEQALGVDDNGEGYVSLTGVTPSFIVEDWSGSSNASTNMAQMEPGTENVFLTDDDQDAPYGAAVCAEGDVTSEYPGMARVKLVVTANANINQDFGQLGLGSAENVFKTQYLAGWMTLDKPSLTEMSAANFGDSADAANKIGDPDGSGKYVGASDGSGFKDGYVDVKVTGNMPMDGDWAGAVGKSSIDLPGDWVTLAKGLASDSNPVDSTPYDLWDTSGDSADTEGHDPALCDVPDQTNLATTPTQELPGTDNYYQPLDNGDNCFNGSTDSGPFSSILGESGNDATGPYDPIDGYDTWLPDGNLDSQDAPMPAARVDVAIAQNTGGTDIGGVGSLEAANKDVTYSRDFTGHADPHNLYAPFYNEYIPATGRGDASSGIDGSVITGDFPNFFNGKNATPKYHFWDTAKIAGNDISTSTGCLNRTYDHTLPVDASSYDYYQHPTGNYDVAVYTDQNGEAQVKYNPNTGYYLNQDPDIAKPNSDNGCDLGATFGKAIGTSAITATAKYPFQPGNFKPQASTTLNKTVISSWEKTIGWIAKGPSDGNNDFWRLVEVHAQNIDGSFDGHEIVCFSAPSDATINPFTGTDSNGISYDGEDLATGPSGDLENSNGNSNRTCEYTDSAGNAIVEILSSSPTVDVVAEFENEGLIRNIDVPFGPGTGTSSPPGTLPPVTVTPTDPSNPTNGPVTVAPAATPTAKATVTAPSLASIQKLAKVFTKNHKAAKAVLARVDTLRLVMPTHHQHYLLVKIVSPHKSAKLSLTLIVRKGNKLVKVNRTLVVRSNRSMKVNVSSSVTKIKGAHLAG